MILPSVKGIASIMKMLDDDLKSTQCNDFSFTDQLCKTALEELRTSRIDQELLDLLFLDWLSYVSLGLKQEEATKLSRTLAKRLPAQIDSETIEELAAPQRGLLLGFSGHFLELDDSEFVGETHPTNLVFSTLVGLTGLTTIPTPHFLKAARAGLKSFYPLGKVLNPKHYNAGWHGTGTVGALASSLTAALFLEFDQKALANSIGFASSQASGIHSSYGFHSKPLNAGKACFAGILSALLTKENLDAPIDAMERKFGFFEMFNAEDQNPKELTWPDQLSFIHPKIYPSCHCTHSTIRSALRVRAQVPIEKIDSIEISGHPYAIEMTANRAPRTREKAFFSSSYCLSAALVFGHLKIKHFMPNSLSAPKVTNLESKVVLTKDDSKNLMETEIKITLKDKTFISASDETLRGFVEHDLEAFETKIVDQFENCGCSRQAYEEIKRQLSSGDSLNLKTIFNQLL